MSESFLNGVSSNLSFPIKIKKIKKNINLNLINNNGLYNKPITYKIWISNNKKYGLKGYLKYVENFKLKK